MNGAAMGNSGQLQPMSTDADHATTASPASASTSNRFFAPTLHTEPVPTRVGSYRVIRELGRGGMGVVYLAVRDDDQLRKHVAIKVIKRGMDTDDILRRFHLERQLLAALNHPNITRVLDAGATDDGRPYFVLEYIEGQRIDRWCDAQRLTIDERLELFRVICIAVHHAHQNLIVHRDLKPSNIIVNSKGEPKLLDFGIAKLLNRDLSPVTADPTDTAVRLMTPEYASPEQVRGDVVTTASDVYSLGVLLYELVSGHRPYNFKTRLQAEIQRIICDEDPEKPSTKSSRLEELFTTSGADDSDVASGESSLLITPESVAKPREGRPDRLRKRLTGDVDDIVMQAMSKKPSQRYASAEQMAEDIRRHLNSLPILARRRNTSMYRLSRFVKRNRIGVSAAAAVVLALIGGTATTAWQASVARHNAMNASQQAVLARQQERLAIQQRDRAQAVTDLFIMSLTSQDPNSPDPDLQGSQDMTVADAMSLALNRLDQGELNQQPATAALLLRTIAEILNGNGRSIEAEAPAEQALKIETGLHSDSHADVAASLNILANVKYGLGRWTEAEALHVRALEMRQRLFKGDHADVAESMHNLAMARTQLGRVAEAQQLCEEALAMRQRLFKGDHASVALSLNDLAIMRGTIESVELHSKALEMRQRLFKGDHPDVAASLHNLALVRAVHEGRLVEAEQLTERALEMRRRLFKGDHESVARSLNNLAMLRSKLGRSAEAEPLAEESLEMYQRLFQGDHALTANCLDTLAQVRRALGRMAEAEQLFVESISMCQRLHPNDNAAVATCVNLSNLADLLQSTGRTAEAEVWYVRALEMSRTRFNGDHPNTADVSASLARCLASLGRLYDALEVAQQAADMASRVLPETSPIRQKCDEVLTDVKKKIADGTSPPVQPQS
jgi:serine/threonine-protein kinase